MKKIIFSFILACSSLSFATVDDNPLRLDMGTQMKIIKALINTETAQNEYVGEVSIADLMERDVASMLSGNLPKNLTIRLNCENPDGEPNTLYCALYSFDDGDEDNGESSLVIDAVIQLSPLSTEIQVSDVRAFIAG